ncbi:MAG: hypothetical protein NC355_09605 [Blautia sp.]|nr:hypothetical protein [Blautia sp.]
MKNIFILCGEVIVGIVAVVFLFSGRFDGAVNDFYMRQSGIFESTEYEQYQSLQKDGMLTGEGIYKAFESEEYQDEVPEETKQVCVTIADNSSFKINYYLDEEKSEKIEEDFIYLDPGEKIYCSTPKIKDSENKHYMFSEFRVYEYDQEGNRGDLFQTPDKDSQLILEIPEDYQGTQLAIIPVGVYEKEKPKFSAVYIDENGNQREVPGGKWKINDFEYLQGSEDSDGIPISDFYTVTYEYDDELYYCASAVPQIVSDKNGVIEFRQSANMGDYAVELHTYTDAVFSFDKNGKKGIASVKLNDDSSSLDIEAGLTKLKEGDILTITTVNDYRIFCKNIPMNMPERVGSGYRYRIKIPAVNKLEFMIVKSKLTVVLDSSVGFDTMFEITASGINESGIYYSKQRFHGDLTVFDGTVGLDEKVQIAAKESALENGCALKVSIEKTDGNSQKLEEIKYIKSVPGSVDIALYNDTGIITNLNKIYKEINVKISLVRVSVYDKPDIANAGITVKLADDAGGAVLTEGDVAEPSREVQVTITPEQGYYISGKHVENNTYVKEMKFSKYLSDIDEIIKEHTVKKLYRITLNKTDPYGTCVYKLNGKEISGTTISVREEDELTLTYELTDADYKIVRESDGFFDGIGVWRRNTFSKTKETVTIPLSADIDGTTIERSQYIKVEKG